jgi:DNA-binding transcriptional LysR family regulator
MAVTKSPSASTVGNTAAGMVSVRGRCVDLQSMHYVVQTCTPACRGAYTRAVAALDNFDWDDLRYFLRAAQTKTLAGAARSMGVEHTTIGRRLSALERALGAPLVLRGPEGLTLTPLGERIAPLVQDVERAVLAAREAATSQRKRVRLSVPQALTGLLTQAVTQLRLVHPSITLEIIGHNRPPDLKLGKVDLAILVTTAIDEDLVRRSLGEVGWSLYAAETYLARRPAPIDPNDLSGHEIVALNTDSPAAPAAKWLGQHAANATVVSRSNASASLVAAAVGGAGLALLPCFLAEAEPALKRLTPDVLTTHPVFLVYRREVRLAEAVRVVIQFVIDLMRQHSERIRG